VQLQLHKQKSSTAVQFCRQGHMLQGGTTQFGEHFVSCVVTAEDEESLVNCSSLRDLSMCLHVLGWVHRDSRSSNSRAADDAVMVSRC
jgi:hypothetical protein